MQAFDLDQLRTLVAVVDAGSVTAGASRVFLSQSAASEQLRKLESHACQVLLHRSKAGVLPTPAGQRLLSHARQLLALSEQAWRDLHEVPLQGELRLAVTDYFRTQELATLLARLNTQHPQVRLHVAVCKSAEVVVAHSRGECDIGLTMRLKGQSDGSSGPLLRQEALQWMAASGLQLRRDEPLPLIVLPEDCALRQFALGLLNRHKRTHTVVHVASGVAGMQSALAAGLGVACLNASALCPGVVPVARPHDLPSLPQAAFHVLPQRTGESEFVTRARNALVEHFAQP